MQTALDQCNLNDNIAVDGDYGPQTKESVQDVQQYFGITVDGVFGPQTSSYMLWPVIGEPGTCAVWT